MEELVIIALCLLLNAFLAAFEMAFVSIPKPELRRQARNGSKEAQRLVQLRENPERTLSVIQIGITLVGAVSAAVGGAGASETLEPMFQVQFGLTESTAELLSIISVVVPLTYLSVILGELVPKSLALKNPVKITLLGARWLWISDRILSPAVTLLAWSTKQVLRLCFPRTPVSAPLPETTVEIDALPPHHQEAILNLAHIEQWKIRDILVPWKNVIHIKQSDSLEALVPLIFASGHTRLPVTDEKGAVLGVLHTKECLALRETGTQDWHNLIRPILRVQPLDSILWVLRLLQKHKNHMAIVGTDPGSPLGIVTLEDISEEIWGDIFDEDEDSRIRKLFVDRIKAKITHPPA